MLVAPFTGAWIETPKSAFLPPSSRVAPFTGAWIETVRRVLQKGLRRVAPFTGAWIETNAGGLEMTERFSRALHGRVD